MIRDALKLARKSKKLTAIELSKITGIKEEKIYAVERGRYNATDEEKTKWAEALGVKAEEVF